MNINYRLKMCARPLVDERRFWLDAAIGATAQHISDAVNYFNVKNTNEANMKIANANNENAYKVALMNNQWSEKMLKYNNQFAAEQARIEREWESPEAYRQRLLAAGINPAVAMSQGSAAGHVAAPQQGSSGVSPSMPVFQNAHMEPFRMLDGSAAFANLGSAIAEMANAKRTDVETEQAQKMMNDVLREAAAKSKMAENAAFLDSCFSFTIKSKEVAHLANQLLLDTESINNFKQEGNKIAAEAAWTRMKEKSEQLLQKIYGEQHREAKQAADTYMDRVHAEIKSMNAQANQANAEATRIRELLPGEKTLQVTQDKLLNAKTDYTFEQVKQSEAVRYKIASECVILTLEASQMRWDRSHREELYDYYIQQLDTIKDMDEKTLRQMGQDYWNPFRYLGTLLSGAAAGVGAAGAKQAMQNPVTKVRGFVP